MRKLSGCGRSGEHHIKDNVNNFYQQLFASVTLLRALILVVVLPLASGVVTAVELTPHSPDQLDAVELGMQWYEDSSGQLTIQQIINDSSRFTPVFDRSPTYGFSDSIFWFLINLDVSERDTDDWILDIGYPLLDSLLVFVVSDGQVISKNTMGDTQPFNQRPIQTRSFALPVKFQPESNELTIAIRLETQSSIQMPVQLMRLHHFHEADHNEQILLGIYYGILLGILCFNLSLALGMRSLVYWLYSCYVFSYFIFQVALNGLGFEYLWPTSPIINQRIVPVSMCFAMFFSVFFAQMFLQLNTKEHNLLYRISTLFLTIQVLFLPLALFGEYQFTIKLLTATAAMIGVLLISSGVYVYYKNGKTARFFLLAWSFFLLGVLVYAAKTLGYLQDSFFAEYAIQIGSALEMILLSYALADRFKRLRDENDNILLTAHQTLEQRVEERTEELRTAMLDLSKANQQLEALSNTDTLTGIHNRNYFKQQYDMMWHSSRRSNSAISLLMIDIDHFKAINDNHGHVVGDTVLVECAKALEQEVHRTTDLLARYGGEEFVVVLSSTELDGALKVAERLRKRIEKGLFFPESHSVSTGETQITISVGVAAIVPIQEAYTNKSDLLERADLALYAAKNDGRNCVRHWQQSLSDKSRYGT